MTTPDLHHPAYHPKPTITATQYVGLLILVVLLLMVVVKIKIYLASSRVRVSGGT